jgi:diguanylate cyclase (GGDEF)-like protein/putative nucleotidyltransferase with HDIG domain
MTCALPGVRERKDPRMQSDGTDSPGMQSLTWADSPTPDLVQPGGPRHQRVPIAGETGLGVQRELMARALAYLFAAGSLITLVLYAVLPHPEASTPGMLAVVLLALAVGVGLEIGAELIPQRAYPWVVAGGSALIGAAVYFRGSPTTAHAFFYVWVACFSFYFFSRGVALAEVAFAGGTYAVVLAGVSHPPEHGLELWLVTLCTLLVTGILITGLRRRIDEMIEGLSSAARTDVLTGLLNRRGFEEAFNLELERARRGGHTLSVLVGDLDNFKHVNDRYGHYRGDVALRQTSDILERRQRRFDTVARIGGEEFALLVPDADDHDAYVLAERLRMSLRDVFASQEVPITISFGIASFPAHGEAYEALLGAADDALYAAKELGRDRTVIYSREVAGILTPIDQPQGPRNEHLSTVLALAEALDVRDAATARHSETVGRYAELIAREIGLRPDVVGRIRLAGMLHDIGKIAVSNMLLTKPEPLSDEEWIEMRRHAEIGARILANARLGDIGEWVLAHHERPDGDGFPFGIANGDIPLEARILAVADAYEAMTADRAYKAAMSPEDACAELRRCAGTQFDPRLVDAFISALHARPAVDGADRA